MKGTEMNTNERIEVRRWVRDAIGLYENAGKETLLREIADSRGRFVSDARYIFALDLNGTMVAHPMEPELTGRNLIDLRDSEGNAFIQKIVDTAKTRGYGYRDYKWRSPGSEDELPKTVFFEQVAGIILCSGFYGSRESSWESIINYLRSPFRAIYGGSWPYGPSWFPSGVSGRTRAGNIGEIPKSAK
ncbi:MAG: cache domain-containing protein [Syntrophobacteraceae bacterium]